MIQVNDSAIIIETEKFIKVLSIRNILFIRADECYSEINTSAGKKILISKTLKETQSYFPDKHFFRCHKSYLINMQYFKELKIHEGLDLQGGAHLVFELDTSNTCICRHILVGSPA